MKVTADLINSIKIDEKIRVGRTVTMSIFIKEKVMHCVEGTIEVLSFFKIL